MTSVSNVDEYGFERSDSEQLEQFMAEYLRVLARRSSRWQVLLPGSERNTSVHIFRHLKRGRRLKRFVRKGVPCNLRTEVWLFLSGAADLMAANKGRYSQLLQGPFQQTVLGDINADLPRTYPNNIHFRSDTGPARQSLSNVLRAFSKHSPDVGYCQGVNYIAALLLLVTDSEEKTFWILVALTDRYVTGYYTRTMDGLLLDTEILSQLVRWKMPALFEHMQMLNVTFSMVCTKWLVCVFADVLPVETTLRVWDSLFYEGSKILFRIGLTMLRVHETKLLQCRDFMDFMSECRAISRTFDVLDCHSFMQMAFKFPNPLSASKLESLRSVCHTDLLRKDIQAKL